MSRFTFHLVPLTSLALTTTVLLAGCAPRATGTLPRIPDLAGRVAFEARTTQATMLDVADRATVSLIQADTGVTKGTTVTNETGGFLLKGETLQPESDVLYYLEAMKGLSNHRPGVPAARIRTLARFSGGGWVTLTNTAINSGILLTPNTTAVSIGAGLKHVASPPFDFAALIGRVGQNGNNDSYDPVPGLTAADQTTLLGMVRNALGQDRDPVGSIRLDAGSWVLNGTSAGLVIGSVSPTSGRVGTAVVVSGSGFLSGSTAPELLIGGVLTPVATWSATEVRFSVASTTPTGTVVVRQAGYQAAGPLFTVTGLLGGIARSNGLTDLGGVVRGED